MTINKIFSFLVPPGKHLQQKLELRGAEIPLRGKLFEMLRNMYFKSDEECNIPICFMPSESGDQQNIFRNSIVDLLSNQKLGKALQITNYLHAVTTNKSGLGLLFIVIGQNESEKYKMVLSRFPADEGVTAEEGADKLTVTFIERVFMKNAHTYKSAMYVGRSFDSDFWEGTAIDRQINSGIKELSDYWIKGFLFSDFKTTPKEGTRRLANAIKQSLNQTDSISIKQEIISAAILSKNLQNKAVSINEFCDNFKLSDEAKNIILKQLKRSDLADLRFLFDLAEFNKHILYKSIILDNGGTLIAPANDFDMCFNQTRIDQNRYRFETTGEIIDTRIRAKN